ncbi:DUF4181 domain-containing protein [Fredinandcohnia onubensis]|uniref:DUF4181 domain-containing protein n=1 Tax=Fredinandcohnia onubensis TaxID=1571209 RepID=UPI000C0BCC1A|nr:DUF4181 domain-containing protein [Fredinandcohnia onubensis]
MGLIILLMFLLLSIIDSLLGKRLEPGYNVAESDGRVKFRVGGILIVILFLGSAYVFFDIDNMNQVKWLLIFFMISIWGFQSFMEWKYVEGKKYKLSLVLMVVSVIATFGIFFTYEKITNTTFGEEVSKYIGETEKIDKIELTWITLDEAKGYIHSYSTITDQSMIQRLIFEPSDMDLMRTRFGPGLGYFVTVYIDEDVYSLVVTESELRIEDKSYEIEGENKLLNLIENEQLEWVEE